MANGKYGRQITECFEYNLNIYLTEEFTITLRSQSAGKHNSADSQEYRYIIQNFDLGTNNCKE